MLTVKIKASNKEYTTQLNGMYDFLFSIGITPKHLKDIETYHNEEEVEVNYKGYTKYFKKQPRIYLVTLENDVNEYILAHNVKQMKKIVEKNNLILKSYKIISIRGEIVYAGL